MNIFLIGERGYLGSFLYLHLSKTHRVDCGSILQHTLDSYHYIINCAGKPDVDWCEQHEKESWNANVQPVIDSQHLFPKTKIINFSSYYVYDNTYHGQGNEESDGVTNKYVYMNHKLISELVNRNGINFRLGKLFGGDVNKQNKFTEYLIKTEDEITVDTVLFNPTSLSHVLNIVNWELEHNKLKGVYNLANTGKVTHEQYAHFIFDVLKKDKTKINTVHKLKRSFDSYGNFFMDISKLQLYTGIMPPDWSDDLTNYLKNYVSTEI